MRMCCAQSAFFDCSTSSFRLFKRTCAQGEAADGCDVAVRMVVSPSRTPCKQVPLPTNAQANSKTCHWFEIKFAGDEMAKIRAIPGEGA
jgi:hypothetical protein